MAEQRLARKDIKEPDHFLTTSVQFMYWIREHTRALAYSTVGLLCIIGLVIAWSKWQQSREAQATTLFYQAKKLLEAGGGTTKQTDTTQIQATLENIVLHYGNTSVSALAHWHLGQMAFESGDYAKAIQAYQQAQQKVSQASNAPMFATITLGIGYAQEANGMYDQAMSSFDTVLQSSAYWLRSEAYMGLGRCYRRTGAVDKANTLRQRVLSDTHLSDITRQSLTEQLSPQM
ncbi:MAG: tetratricopeptide repeat protein [Candidatus Tectimicrobiota bacterium]